MTISESAEQIKKAHSSMMVTEFGIVRDESDEQEENACSPIEVTEFPITID